MSITFTYNLLLKRGSDVKNIKLPILKESDLIPKKMIVKSEQKMLEIKMIGKETILSIGESILYQKSEFDLANQISQIIDCDQLELVIKNLCADKNVPTVPVTIILNYEKTHSNIIYNNIYQNLSPDTLKAILEDIAKTGKYISKIVFTSPNHLSSIKLTPQFESTPQWLKPIELISNNRNEIIIDMSSEMFDPDLINQLKYYTLTLADNVDRLGLVIYGFAK